MLVPSTSAEGTASFPSIPCADDQINAWFPGFEESNGVARLSINSPAQLKLTLRTHGLSEHVQVSESADLLQPNRTTQSTTLSASQIQSLPTASRNITHLIVLEAGVSAPLPDRTGRGMNIATHPEPKATTALSPLTLPSTGLVLLTTRSPSRGSTPPI